MATNKESYQEYNLEHDEFLAELTYPEGTPWQGTISLCDESGLVIASMTVSQATEAAQQIVTVGNDLAQVGWHIFTGEPDHISIAPEGYGPLSFRFLFIMLHSRMPPFPIMAIEADSNMNYTCIEDGIVVGTNQVTERVTAGSLMYGKRASLTEGLVKRPVQVWLDTVNRETVCIVKYTRDAQAQPWMIHYQEPTPYDRLLSLFKSPERGKSWHIDMAEELLRAASQTVHPVET